MPRAFSASAMPASVPIPLATMPLIIGATNMANCSAFARTAAWPSRRASSGFGAVAQQRAARLLGRERFAGPLGNPPPLHLGERRVEVERERVGVGA
jgi:hypothetical protein